MLPQSDQGCSTGLSPWATPIHHLQYINSLDHNVLMFKVLLSLMLMKQLCTVQPQYLKQVLYSLQTAFYSAQQILQNLKIVFNGDKSKQFDLFFTVSK